MTDVSPIQGELQAQIMPVIWRLGAASVEQVRTGLPRRYRGAYTTVQTVLNRLAERGLLERERRGNLIVYRPRITEADFFSRSIESTLSGASSQARRAVLAQLIGGLDAAELSELQALGREVQGKRKRRGS